MDTYPTIGYPVSDEELRVAWQTAEERCQLLLKYIPDLVFALDEGGMIIAINEDPKAQIFDVAHYAIIGDIYEIIPGLIETIKEMKKA